MPIPDSWCSDMSPKHLGQPLGMSKTPVQRNPDAGLSRLLVYTTSSTTTSSTTTEVPTLHCETGIPFSTDP